MIHTINAYEKTVIKSYKFKKKFFSIFIVLRKAFMWKRVSTWDECKNTYKGISGGGTRKTLPLNTAMVGGDGFDDNAVRSPIRCDCRHLFIRPNRNFFIREFDRTKRVKLESAQRAKSYAKQSLILFNNNNIIHDDGDSGV